MGRLFSVGYGRENVATLYRVYGHWVTGWGPYQELAPQSARSYNTGYKTTSGMAKAYP